jgi:hypothetical protein
MKTVILAGGFGTRLSEYTDDIPKPMVPIGGMPMLVHIMGIYAHYNYKDFVLALGYKADRVKSYFLNYYTLHSDFTIDMATGERSTINRSILDWKVTLMNTGLNTMTGGRLRRLEPLLKHDDACPSFREVRGGRDRQEQQRQGIPRKARRQRGLGERGLFRHGARLPQIDQIKRDGPRTRTARDRCRPRPTDGLSPRRLLETHGHEEGRAGSQQDVGQQRSALAAGRENPTGARTLAAETITLDREQPQCLEISIRARTYS